VSDQHEGNGTVWAARAAEDFGEVRDVTVIGAGPVGMIATFWAGMREASSRLVDSLPDIGGQLTTLYPEKWIFDVPGYPKVLAKDLVAELRKQSIEQFEVPVHLETTALRLEYEPDPEDGERKIVRLVTDKGELRSRTLLIAGGHGAFEPKKLPGMPLDEWEGRGLHYLVGEKSEFEALIHRREQFRAHEVTVGEIMEAREAGRVQVLTPYQLKTVEGDGQMERITVFHSEDAERLETLPCDALLLQLGFKTALGPLAEWGFEIEKGAIKVDHLMKTSLEAVWACGDITTFDGKLKLIATGFGEAAIAVAQAIHHVRPDMRIQPKYSTNTGVPGVVEGQP